jgi:hypothetical protein
MSLPANCFEEVDIEKGDSEAVLPSDIEKKDPGSSSSSVANVPISSSSSMTQVDYALPRTDSQATKIGDGVSEEKGGPLTPAQEEKSTSQSPAKVVGTTDHLKSKPAQFKVTWERASRWVRFKLWFNTYRLVSP